MDFFKLFRRLCFTGVPQYTDSLMAVVLLTFSGQTSHLPYLLLTLLWFVTVIIFFFKRCREVYCTVMASLFNKVFSKRQLESSNIFFCFRPLLAVLVPPPGVSDVTVNSFDDSPTALSPENSSLKGPGFLLLQLLSSVQNVFGLHGLCENQTGRTTFSHSSF